METTQISPKCQDGRHFQCPGFWWVIDKHIALVCKDWCHDPAFKASIGNSAAH